MRGIEVAKGVTTLERLSRRPRGRSVAADEAIRRNGQMVGFATASIAPGTTRPYANYGMGNFTKDYAIAPTLSLPQTSIFRRPSTAFAAPTAASTLASSHR
jgi:arabinonate dehydratase